MASIRVYLCGSKKPIEPLEIVIGLFLVAIGIQLIYLLIFLIAFSKRMPPTSTGDIPVSVVVCAHDEEENLRRLVPALLAQEYSNFEVIIVNDRSNDHTFDYLLEESNRDPRLKMVNVKETPERVNGKKYGLTLGIRAATNDWILLTDADCMPGPRWIKSMSERFTERSKFVLGFSPYLSEKGMLNRFIRFETLLTAIQYFAFGFLGSPYMGVGRNLAYRKSLFLDQKGFNNYLHVTGGDDDLFVNMHARGSNTSFQLAPESHVYSEPKHSWRSFHEQKVRHLSVGKRYRFTHRLSLGIFNLTWILSWLIWPVLLGWLIYRAAGGAEIFVQPETYLVIFPFVLRWALMMLLFNSMLKKASVSFSLWALPFMDIIYAFYYLSTGLVALNSKKVRWRN